MGVTGMPSEEDPAIADTAQSSQPKQDMMLAQYHHESPRSEQGCHIWVLAVDYSLGMALDYVCEVGSLVGSVLGKVPDP